MAVTSKGTTYSTGDQVTATGLNNLVDNATFASGAVDDSTTQINGSGQIVVKDAGITGDKLSAGAPSWDGSGNVDITGELDISGASAGQVKFPSTQNASADPNTLDDYEEGTWTPSIGGTATYSSQSGTYTKIGRLVFVTGSLSITSIGTGSQYEISGFPFTAASDAALGVSNWANADSSINYIVVGMNSGTTTAAVRGNTSASTSIDITVNFFADSANIKFSGVYYV